MQKHNSNLCPQEGCPDGIESLRKITLTSEEKRGIFLGLIEEIEDRLAMKKMLNEIDLQSRPTIHSN